MMTTIELNMISTLNSFFLLELLQVMARLLLTLSKVARPRIMLMEMQLVFERNSRINMNPFLPLLWLSWIRNLENHHLRKVKIMKFGILSWRTFALDVVTWDHAFQKINS
jgi:hypothetical protein